MPLSVSTTTSYIAWLGFRPEPLADGNLYTVGQVGGLAASTFLLITLAWACRLPPRRVASTVFWSLLAINIVDLGFRPGENIWLAVLFVIAPLGWLGLHAPAAYYDERLRRRWSDDVAPLFSRPPQGENAHAEPPDVEAQIRAWREYRDRLWGPDRP